MAQVWPKLPPEEPPSIGFTPPKAHQRDSLSRGDGSFSGSPLGGRDRSRDISPGSPRSLKKEWLSQKRAEYSHKLLSPGPQDSIDYTKELFKTDVLTSAAIGLSWDSRQIVQANISMIQKIFSSYASYGEVELSKDMNSANFHRLISDSFNCSTLAETSTSSLSRQETKSYTGFVNASRKRPNRASQSPQVDPRDIEFLFVEYSRLSQKDPHTRTTALTNSMFPVDCETVTDRICEAKISFEDFINLLQRLAVMSYPEQTDHQALAVFLKKHIHPLLQSDIVQTGFHDLSCVTRLKAILQNPTQLKMLGILYKNIQVYFTFYTSCRGKMDFKGFQSFFKDFGIYPSLVSSQNLQTYFAALASLEVS